MATDPRRLKPGELCRLLNSTPLGEVLTEGAFRKHRNRAGMRLGTGPTVDLLAYAAWLVLQRHAVKPVAPARGKSEVNLAISSAHCPGCGAPEKGGTSPACEHCGVTLNDGRHGWVLTAVRSPQEAHALLAPLRGAAMGMEHADGEVGEPRRPRAGERQLRPRNRPASGPE